MFLKEFNICISILSKASGNHSATTEGLNRTKTICFLVSSHQLFLSWFPLHLLLCWRPELDVGLLPRLRNTPSIFLGLRTTVPSLELYSQLSLHTSLLMLVLLTFYNHVNTLKIFLTLLLSALYILISFSYFPFSFPRSSFSLVLWINSSLHDAYTADRLHLCKT